MKDKSKAELLRLQLAYLRWQYPEADIAYHFYDDLLPVIEHNQQLVDDPFYSRRFARVRVYLHHVDWVNEICYFDDRGFCFA